jgi:hypothetical protein
MEYILDMKKSGYTLSDVKNSLDSLGENGRNAYIRNLFTIDIVHPILLSFLLLIGLSLLINKINFKKKILTLLLLFPILYLITDILENIFIALLINEFPYLSFNIVKFTSFLTVIKWISLNIGFIIFFILLIWMIIIFFIRFIKKINTNEKLNEKN